MIRGGNRQYSPPITMSSTMVYEDRKREECEVQLQHFPFLTRGLCAVVCYYDAHRFISASVRALAELKINEEIPKSDALTSTLNALLTDTAFVKRLIEVLQTVSVQTELQNLHQPHVNGLGGPKHQEILRELIEEILTNCAHTLYLISSSWRLDSVPPFLDNLFTPLKNLQPTALFQNTHLPLWIAALILISPHNLLNSMFLHLTASARDSSLLPDIFFFTLIWHFQSQILLNPLIKFAPEEFFCFSFSCLLYPFGGTPTFYFFGIFLFRITGL
ncbi:unnamed protein product [Gongylonema pulchrum]|uniref:COMM domain-containing protein n=1 Tax=Gongylonema pulchrum TaxID=637853 RepID=A0A183EK46_9BILA|nr:unnamed protein product [Gongylonema pulchrum]